MCVLGVGVGSGWSGFGRGLGRVRGGWRMKSPTPFPSSRPQKPGKGGCLLSLLCVLQMCQNGGGWEGRVPGRAAPEVALSKQYSSPAGDSKTGERVGVGTWGFPMYSCVYSGVFSVWYPLWASMCV
uniref:Uncharacterized protein n=1 Tax=Pongo abelii TaxID=9601 RepID=A0A8I5TH45_PONAB